MTAEGTCECDAGLTYLGQRYRACYDAVACSTDELTLGPTGGFIGYIDVLTYDLDGGLLTPDIVHNPACPITCSY